MDEFVLTINLKQHELWMRVNCGNRVYTINTSDILDIGKDIRDIEIHLYEPNMKIPRSLLDALSACTNTEEFTYRVIKYKNHINDSINNYQDTADILYITRNMKIKQYLISNCDIDLSRFKNLEYLYLLNCRISSMKKINSIKCISIENCVVEEYVESDFTGNLEIICHDDVNSNFLEQFKHLNSIKVVDWGYDNINLMPLAVIIVPVEISSQVKFSPIHTAKYLLDMAGFNYLQLSRLLPKHIMTIIQRYVVLFNANRIIKSIDCLGDEYSYFLAAIEYLKSI